MTVLIRPTTAADRDDVHRVVREAFGEEGPQIVGLLTDLEASGKVATSLVAELDEDVVGHVQLNASWVDARRALVDVLVLSPLSVVPAHQGRGIGGALVAAAITRASEAGAPALFLEGSPGYYSERGFEPASAHGFTPPSNRIPGPAFQVVLLDRHEPWMTGALVYCDAFWAHDCVGLRDPLLAELEQRFSG
jgi:putative acetyltransferase